MFSLQNLNSIERYLLHLADNGLISSQRMAEWCGQAPELEIEMALANIGLDYLGQARLWLDLLIQQLKQKKVITSEDEIAYLRDERDFSNLLILEQPNGDYAMTITKIYFYSIYQELLQNEIHNCSQIPDIPAVSSKVRLEIKYHIKFSKHWMQVMINGTEESQKRIHKAVYYLWPYCGEFFQPATYEKKVLKKNTEKLFNNLKLEWLNKVLPVIQPLIQTGLDIDKSLSFYLPLGKEYNHGEYLSHLLGEFQSLHRRFQGVHW